MTDAPSNPAARKITARHVLTHSSGLPNWRGTAELVPEFAPGTDSSMAHWPVRA